MSTPQFGYVRLDDVALAAGLGFVLLGLVVMGTFETLLGSAYFTERVPGVGVIVVHTSFNPHFRAHVIALGTLILLVWGFSRLCRAILASLRADW